jgi:hypothetical protein
MRFEISSVFRCSRCGLTNKDKSLVERHIDFTRLYSTDHDDARVEEYPLVVFADEDCEHDVTDAFFEFLEENIDNNYILDTVRSLVCSTCEDRIEIWR